MIIMVDLHDMCIFFVYVVPNVYSFPVLTLEFCNLLLQELDHFEKSDMPKGRPNTMNNYGVSIIICTLPCTYP